MPRYNINAHVLTSNEVDLLWMCRRMPLADATRVAQKLYFIGRLSKLRRQAEEVTADRDKAMKDPAKRKVRAA